MVCRKCTANEQTKLYVTGQRSKVLILMTIFSLVALGGGLVLLSLNIIALNDNMLQASEHRSYMCPKCGYIIRDTNGYDSIYEAESMLKFLPNHL